ncbi:hypothetical protein DFH28DRAFT_1079969 [Melampsora americana]|nr:hypothetical protein DFH28DRAFT_1079969 [Melampsora americana]
MPSNQGRVTRSGRGGDTPATDTLPAAKRIWRSANQQPDGRINEQMNAPNVEQPNAANKERIELSNLTLKNYHEHKKDWPLARIQAQLARQASSNHQISAAVIAEGQALLKALDHTVHMLAMVSCVSLTKLKRSLGMVGGIHGENPWHWWLSFALDANNISMPMRGAHDAGEQLARCNKANSTTYQALEDNEYMVFTAKIFYALGGYPNYSSITVTEDPNVFGDSSILVPEVPKLSIEDKNQYRPIYKKLDRRLNTPAASDAKEERRSLQFIKKIAQQLARDHQLMGVDYYLIACSHNNKGGGWCQEYTTRDEISSWVELRAQLQRVFPLYCQNGEILEEIKVILGALLSDMLELVLGYKPPIGRGFSRTPNPIDGIKARKLPIIVQRAPDSSMTNEEFQKGFSAMDAKEQRHWIDDIKNEKFKILKSNATNKARGGGGETSTEACGGNGETSIEGYGNSQTAPE